MWNFPRIHFRGVYTVTNRSTCELVLTYIHNCPRKFIVTKDRRYGESRKTVVDEVDVVDDGFVVNVR